MLAGNEDGFLTQSSLIYIEQCCCVYLIFPSASKSRDKCYFLQENVLLADFSKGLTEPALYSWASEVAVLVMKSSPKETVGSDRGVTKQAPTGTPRRSAPARRGHTQCPGCEPPLSSRAAGSLMRSPDCTVTPTQGGGGALHGPED